MLMCIKKMFVVHSIPYKENFYDDNLLYFLDHMRNSFKIYRVFMI